MDWPYNAIASGCPRPREDLFKIQPAAAEVVREDKLLPCLVVLYSVFGLLKERQANQENTFSSTVRGYYNMCVSVIFKYEVLQWSNAKQNKLLLNPSVLREYKNHINIPDYRLWIKRKRHWYLKMLSGIKVTGNQPETFWPFPLSTTRLKSYFEGWLSSEKDRHSLSESAISRPIFP